MKVKGIGTDICAVKRVEELLKKQGERFVERVLTESEIEAKGGLEALEADAPFMTRRFAAKEAIAKALGTGIGKQIGFHDMIIDRKGNHRPVVTFANGKMEGITVHLSVSDEHDFALAFAVAVIDGEEASVATSTLSDSEKQDAKPKRTRKPFGRRNTKKEDKAEVSELADATTADADTTEAKKMEEKPAEVVSKPVEVAEIKPAESTGIQVTVLSPTADK